MNKVASFVAGVAAVGAGIAAAAYYYQKKGVINIEVSYENERGQTVTRPLDALMYEKAAQLAHSAADAASDFAHNAANATVSLARAAKTTVSEQLEKIDRQLRRAREQALELAKDAESAHSADELMFGELELV